MSLVKLKELRIARFVRKDNLILSVRDVACPAMNIVFKMLFRLAIQRLGMYVGCFSFLAKTYSLSFNQIEKNRHIF
jgi:hypothetical protein